MDGFYSSPDSCSTFLQCLNGTLKTMECPLGLVFNPNSSKCDYIQNVQCALKTIKELQQDNNQTYSCKTNPCKEGSTCLEVDEIGFECYCSKKSHCGCPSSGKLCDYGYNIANPCKNLYNNDGTIDCFKNLKCIYPRLMPRGLCTTNLIYDPIQNMCVQNSTFLCAQN